jgi:ClpX C4-type zinc finger
MPAVTERPVIAACSFCLKPDTEVATLVAGPGVFICNECVDLCAHVIAQRPASRQPMTAPWEHAADLDDVLRLLPKAAAAGAQVEENLTGWVRRARSLGATWARIGEALGMTRQSAWERFSGEE